MSDAVAATRERRLDEIAAEQWTPYEPLNPPNEGTCDGCAERKMLTWTWKPTEAWVCDECHDDNPVGELIEIARALSSERSVLAAKIEAVEGENAAMREVMRLALERAEYNGPLDALSVVAILRAALAATEETK